MKFSYNVDVKKVIKLREPTLKEWTKKILKGKPRKQDVKNERWDFMEVLDVWDDQLAFVNYNFSFEELPTTLDNIEVKMAVVPWDGFRID